MFLKNLCILVFWTKVASALEGLRRETLDMAGSDASLLWGASALYLRVCSYGLVVYGVATRDLARALPACNF